MKIGVLALQGAVAEHIAMFSALGAEAIPVRLPSQLDSLDSLVIPGGESTTIGQLLYEYHLIEPLRLLASKGFPLFGTCAGMILLAKKAADLQWQPVSAIDIEVKRNAFGRQVDSFEVDLAIPALGDKPFHGVFIRAPIIDRVNPGVDILCRVNGSVVAVKQGKALACAFHPELTDDSRFHRYFLDLVTGEAIAQGSSR